MTGSDEVGRPTVEIAHEALIRTWPRLRELIDANRDKLRWRVTVMRAMKNWEELGKLEDMLLPSGFLLERGLGLSG